MRACIGERVRAYIGAIFERLGTSPLDGSVGLSDPRSPRLSGSRLVGAGSPSLWFLGCPGGCPRDTPRLSGTGGDTSQKTKSENGTFGDLSLLPALGETTRKNASRRRENCVVVASAGRIHTLKTSVRSKLSVVSVVSVGLGLSGRVSGTPQRWQQPHSFSSKISSN